MRCHDVTALAHEWIAPALHDGALAVDATAGTGRDTRFLAQAVGDHGRVHAFDIQAAAIARARTLLRAEGLELRVQWHAACHSRAGECLPDGALDAVMFNLGWLPGSDRTIVTRPRTTVAALGALLPRLRPAGRLGVVAYRGHPGGTEEERAVAEWVRGEADNVETLVECSASPARRAPVLRVLARR